MAFRRLGYFPLELVKSQISALKVYHADDSGFRYDTTYLLGAICRGGRLAKKPAQHWDQRAKIFQKLKTLAGLSKSKDEWDQKHGQCTTSGMILLLTSFSLVRNSPYVGQAVHAFNLIWHALGASQTFQKRGMLLHPGDVCITGDRVDVRPSKQLCGMLSRLVDKPWLSLERCTVPELLFGLFMCSGSAGPPTE